MANYLEQLVSEWYEFQGYFVRNNIFVGKRKKGGYEGELDVVAFHPSKFHLVHIEPSMDALPWSVRESRYKKKFMVGSKYIPEIFKGMKIPDSIDQIALFGFIGKRHPKNLAGGEVITLCELLREIHSTVKNNSIAKNIIPEKYPILRTIMFINEHRKDIFSEDYHSLK